MQEITGEADIGRHAVYKPELIEYKGKTARGCRSRDFLSDGEELMESTELLAMHGMDYAAKDEPDSIQDPEASAREFLDAMKRNTTLDAFDMAMRPCSTMGGRWRCMTVYGKTGGRRKRL